MPAPCMRASASWSRRPDERGHRGPAPQGFGQEMLLDSDPAETQEWLESFDAIVDRAGPTRAREVMLNVLERARDRHVALPGPAPSDYLNTIPSSAEPVYPGDRDIERRIRSYVRWNAAMIVHRAQRPGLGVGGHIST
jgi:pyruvate dehydrogenase E1 component